MRPFRITYLNFQGRTVTKYWRAADPSHIRSKALKQPDCRMLGLVEAVSDELFIRHAGSQRRTPQAISIRNRS